MYLSELRINWQALLSASVGIGLGSALSHYTMSLFGPPLLAEFGWTKAQFALIGALPVVTLLLAPFAGRFTDRFGARRAASLGFVALSLGFLGFTQIDGSLPAFFAIYALQHVFGILTTSLVFCRVIVERFDRARGLALSLLMTMPPLAGAIAAPLLGSLIAAEGWRAGYAALAAVTAFGGLIAVGAMRAQSNEAAKAWAAKTPPFTAGSLRKLLSHRGLLMLLAGMFLVNLPQAIASSQLKLVLEDAGVAASTATWMLSVYAVGVIVGRFLSGLALDRIPAHLVALAALGLPAAGYAMLGSGAVQVGPVFLAILLIGLAQGAEGDLGAYFVSRNFDMANFSLLLSFVTAVIGGGSAVGSGILSLMLHQGFGYSAFLLFAAVTTAVGAALFALTAKSGDKADPVLSTGQEMALEQVAKGEVH
ncbi:MFS transporter [Novosphingobium sp. M1R2S20]|uniref:MFS transporter n=1 Tax=Novosphingobium rhizovicinum TaxID=3228928 RepID=A0ABV3REK7_9SPHN